eukprot:TRINITY_DN11015_c0_g2_i1.p1 TRINITY_DN11015_c0_g2~~TRINITY_DN11015_c0_g2_i1.p1  ORF type:complete len:664 (+),score=147.11 TRINITY_DN11015_c0_g2_i1:90-2081(+)
MLALPVRSGVKVSSCGRLVDVALEPGSRSIAALRRELAQESQLANPDSLDVLDASGRLLKSDADLDAALAQSQQPLQARFTAAALHEIEQRKLESRSTEHGLHSLQWQIVIEEVAGFSKQVQGMAGEIQGLRDFCTQAVQDLASQEALQRDKVFAAIGREASDRKGAQSDLLARIDALMHAIQSEQSAREVADYQLSTQTDQALKDMGAERNARVAAQQEANRQLASLAHESEVRAQRMDEHAARSTETLAKMDRRLAEQSSSVVVLQQRITQLETLTEKLQTSAWNTDSTVAKHYDELKMRLNSHEQELERAVKTGIFGKELDANRLEQEHVTSVNNIGTRVQRIREEMAQTLANLYESMRTLEARCGKLEQEQLEKQDTHDERYRTMLQKVHETAVSVDDVSAQSARGEASLRRITALMEEVQERMQAAETALESKVNSDIWKVQLEAVAQVSNRQDLRTAQLEREVQARFAQEAVFRDKTKAQLYSTMKAWAERVAAGGASASGAGSERGGSGRVRMTSPSAASTASSEVQATTLRGRVGSSAQAPPGTPPGKDGLRSPVRQQGIPAASPARLLNPPRSAAAATRASASTSPKPGRAAQPASSGPASPTTLQAAVASAAAATARGSSPASTGRLRGARISPVVSRSVSPVRSPHRRANAA